MASPCPERMRAPCVAALAVFTASLCVYSATAARTIYWGDPAEFVAVASTLGIAHPPGYPLYTLLAALVVKLPFGAPFFRLSLLSALLSAGTAAVAALSAWVAASAAVPGRMRTAPRLAGALLAGGLLAFGTSFWSRAVVPEAGALSAFLTLSMLLLFAWWSRGRGRESGPVRGEASGAAPAAGPDASLGREWDPARGGGWAPVRRGKWDPVHGLVALEPPSFLCGDRPVVLVGLAAGLALGNNPSAALLVLPIALGLLAGGRRPTPGALTAGLLLTLLGLSLYAYLPLRAAHDPPMLWAPVNTWRHLADQFAGMGYAPLVSAAPLVEVAHKLREFAAGLPFEVTWIGLAMSVVGVVVLLRSSRVLGVVLVAWAVLVVGHATVYRHPDISDYYVPVYAALCVAAGVGLAWIASSSVWRRTTPSIGRLALLVAVALPATLAWSGWSANDRHDERGARVYLNRLLDSIEPGGVVATMTDRVLFPLRFALYVDGVRDDISVMSVREYAPHLERWCPDVRFPSEGEICSAFESPPSQGGVPARDSVPVGNYLPLVFSLNADEKPLYTDAELALRLFADRSLPRGILVQISPTPIDSIPAEEKAAHDDFWRVVLRETGLSSGRDLRTTEVYAKTLAEHGVLLLERGEIESAVNSLERACALAPEVPMCHTDLGVALERSGRRDDALAQFEVAIGLNPGLADPHLNIALASRTAGDLGRATSELEIAVALEPDNPYYRMELGGVLEQRSEFERAEKMYRSAALLSGDDWGTALAYGDFLRRRKRYADAVAAYQRVEELRPGSESVLRGLGRCYWALDDREQALAVTRRLVELQPYNPAPRFDLAVMLHRSGREREAVRQLDDVIRILPNMWEARALKASILGQLGRYWEARRLFEEALRSGADGPAFWETWISMEESLGDKGMEEEVRDRERLANGARADTGHVGNGARAVASDAVAD